MIRIYSQIHHTGHYSKDSSIMCPVWLNGWVFIYKVSGCGFKFRCSPLNFRYPAVSRKEFLNIQAFIGCRFTMKRIRHMIRKYSQMRGTDKYSHHSSIIWPVWLNDWVFVYEIVASWFDPRWKKYRVWIYSETYTWHNMLIQSNAPYK